MIPRATASLAIVVTVLFAGTQVSAGTCSSDVFAVDGVALGVEVCDVSAPPPHGKPALPASGEIRETLTAKGRPPLVRGVRYERLPSVETARTLDDIPLQALGIEKTMHVTLAVREGNARLEHALLVPGAVSLK